MEILDNDHDYSDQLLRRIKKASSYTNAVFLTTYGKCLKLGIPLSCFVFFYFTPTR